MNYVCGYLFLQFKDGREFHQINPSQTLPGNVFTVPVITYESEAEVIENYIVIAQLPNLDIFI